MSVVAWAEQKTSQQGVLLGGTLLVPSSRALEKLSLGLGMAFWLHQRRGVVVCQNSVGESCRRGPPTNLTHTDGVEDAHHGPDRVIDIPT